MDYHPDGSGHAPVKPIYDPELLMSVICEKIACGDSLRKISQQDGMPSPPTVVRWVAENPKFAEQYARAKERQMDHYAEEIIEISDDTGNDTHVTTYEGGVERTSPNTEWISRSRLRVDSRKWLMSKLAPKKYGEFLKVDQSTKHSVDDSVGALMQRIAEGGKRIQDK